MKKNSSTTIRLTIFNENFWQKGLIYSQNILPLRKLIENSKLYSLEIIAFISFIELFKYRNEIKLFIIEQRSLNINVRVFPTLYVPSKILYPRWFVIPYLFLNLSLYVLYFAIKDYKFKGKLYYNLRSYQIALVFNVLYFNKTRLVFDPRTDMLTELLNFGVWKNDSLSYKMWQWFERIIVNYSYKTIFISEPMKEDILLRCNLIDNEHKYYIYNNQVDFGHFKRRKNTEENNFLYTGSLGNWNSLRNYLLFFKKINVFMPQSSLYIVTNTDKSKYGKILDHLEFEEIRKKVHFFHNPSYASLPLIYSNCTFGLQLMSLPDSRVGVKFVEYIAAGLLPIVNKNVRGASDFVNKYSIGFILDNNMEMIDSEFCEKLLMTKLSESLSSAVKKVLDVNQSYAILKSVFD